MAPPGRGGRGCLWYADGGGRVIPDHDSSHLLVLNECTFGLATAGVGAATGAVESPITYLGFDHRLFVFRMGRRRPAWSLRAQVWCEMTGDHTSFKGNCVYYQQHLKLACALNEQWIPKSDFLSALVPSLPFPGKAHGHAQ